MSQQIINTGALPNDGEGDPLRTAFTKINNNFTELYSISSAEGPNGAIQYNLVTTGSGATGNTELTGSVVTTLNIIAAGTGYKPINPPQIVITPAVGDTTGQGATAYAVVTGNIVSNVVITSGGSNYTLPPVVEFIGTTDNELKGSSNLVYSPSTGNLNIGANIIPLATDAFSIGSSANKIGNLYVGQTALKLGNLNVSESGNAITLTVIANSAVKGSFVANTVFVDRSVVGTNASSTTSAVSSKTFNNNADQVIFQMPIGSFTTGSFTINSYEDWSANNQSVVLVGARTGDGTGVQFTGTSMMFSGNLVVQDYDMTVVDGNLKVLVTTFPNANVTHKIAYQINN